VRAYIKDLDQEWRCWFFFLSQADESIKLLESATGQENGGRSIVVQQKGLQYPFRLRVDKGIVARSRSGYVERCGAG